MAETPKMTFAEFQATRRWYDDLADMPDWQYPRTDPPECGYGYLDTCLYIDKRPATGWPSGRPEAWLLVIGNRDWLSDDLERQERRLFDFAINEGYVEPDRDYDAYLVAREFESYPVESLPKDIPEWLICTAWHNDAMPIWGDHNYAMGGDGPGWRGIALSIDYPDPAMRDTPDWPRFGVWEMKNGETVLGHNYSTDDWQEALMLLEGLRNG